MRKVFLILMSVFSAAVIRAREPEIEAVSDKPAQVDSVLAMKGLLASLPPGVHIMQSESVRDGFNSIVEANAGAESFVGFRIKVFQSSAQSAREESERIVSSLSEWCPSLPVYRSFSSPYFKVAVGDFRTRVDAEKTLRMLRNSFPTATIVKEKMKYPYID